MQRAGTVKAGRLIAVIVALAAGTSAPGAAEDEVLGILAGAESGAPFTHRHLGWSRAGVDALFESSSGGESRIVFRPTALVEFSSFGSASGRWVNFDASFEGGEDSGEEYMISGGYVWRRERWSAGGSLAYLDVNGGDEPHYGAGQAGLALSVPLARTKGGCPELEFRLGGFRTWQDHDVGESLAVYDLSGTTTRWDARILADVGDHEDEHCAIPWVLRDPDPRRDGLVDIDVAYEDRDTDGPEFRSRALSVRAAVDAAFEARSPWRIGSRIDFDWEDYDQESVHGGEHDETAYALALEGRYVWNGPWLRELRFGVEWRERRSSVEVDGADVHGDRGWRVQFTFSAWPFRPPSAVKWMIPGASSTIGSQSGPSPSRPRPISTLPPKEPSTSGR